MPVSLDTRKAHLVRQHGDITAVYTWVNDERALVLVAHLRPGSPWYVVMESAAWKYDDAEYLAKAGKKACEVLGIESSLRSWVRVATIINEGIPDLTRMPAAPLPDYLKGDFGRMVLREQGRVLTEQAIQIAKEGPTYG